MDQDVKILDAKETDAKDIGNIQTQTWLTSYINPSIGITKEQIEQKIKQWKEQGDARIIAKLLDPNSRTWMAKIKGEPIGFIGVLKNNYEAKIEAIHILPNYQGQGIGTQLMETALTWLDGCKKITIEVVSYNKRAIDLYKRFGFEEKGEAVDDIITLPSGKIIPKVLMVKEI